MRLCFGLALAILLTGNVHGIVREATLYEGDSYIFTVLTLTYTVEQCYLKTPSGDVIEFAPGDETQSDDKYVIGQGNSMARCELTLNNADQNDHGNWEMYFSYDGGTGSSQEYIITIISNGNPESQSNESDEKHEGQSNEASEGEETNQSEENKDENYVPPEITTTLGQINHFLLRGAVVDISLNKEEFEEECYVIPPLSDMIPIDLLNVVGITVHGKSNFVSCRMTMGPLTDDLFGFWQLCGKSVINGEIRCQPVTITRDTTNWRYSTYSRVPQPVHYGGTLHSGVAGSGSTLSCHVITPAGEDLVMSSEVTYPHIERFQTTSVSCSMIFKDITEDMLGEWEIMGRFRTSQSRVYEYRQPLNFFLYNPDNPYEQAYNVTVLQDAELRVHLDGHLTLEVGQRMGVINECNFRTPSGQLFDLSNYQQNTIEGVHFATSDSEAMCQIIFSPITQQSTGIWQMSGKFVDGVLFNEIHRTFEIIKEDPANPIEDERDREITLFAQQTLTMEMDTTQRVIIAPISSSSIVHESCHLITPTGLHYSFIEGFHLPGVEILNENRVECGIALTLISYDMVGNWMLVTRARRSSSNYIERRQPFTVRVLGDEPSQEDNEDIDNELDFENMVLLSQIEHSTIRDSHIDISLNKESFEEDCYILPPRGGVIKTDYLEMEGVTVRSKSSFVSCRVTIGPMSDNLLGLWQLCGKSTVTKEARCQPVSIAWFNINWQIRTLASVSHPVNYGGFVHTGVSGTGAITTCHAITPAGEDLVLSGDVKYANIEQLATNQVLCSIVFRDITEDMIGEWTVIGRFYHRNTGIIENRLPMNFYLYNPENPFDQAYNVTELQDEQRLVHVGGQLVLEVTQRSGLTRDCIYKTPTGQTFDLSNQQGNSVEGVTFWGSPSAAACQIIFSPVSREAVGTWEISGKFNNGVLFDELRQTFELIEEDPENPIEDEEDREITMLANQLINTEMGSTHRVVIAPLSTSSIVHESCHLVTPTGLQYTFVDAFYVPGINIINENRVECGVNLDLNSYDMIGDWMLITRAMNTRPVTYIERRQPFTIRVEENFVLQDDITIAEGADLYLHLNYETSMPDTCAVFGPDGAQYVGAEEDPLYPVSCGFIVRGVDHSHAGTWVIEYGADVRWRGSVNVNVFASQPITVNDLRWRVGDSIDIPLGPEEAVFCRIEDPHKHVVFKHFGQCKLVLDRVTIDHKGLWHMYVGTPGAVVLQTIGFYVDLRDDSPLITTAVEKNTPSVKMSCSVPNEHVVNSCTFMTPGEEILVAAHGVGQNGYMFNGSFINDYQSDAHSHDCTLRLLNPTAADMGIWRCGLKTTTGTYYAFLTVVCPHLMQDPQIAASVVTEPVLHSVEEFTYEEDEPVVMTCSVPAEMRYCYFRTRNGTVYNVFPTMSSSLPYEYVGEGLDAGDCGIRFKNGLSHTESGTWSCHAGLVSTTGEQRASFNVDIRVKMSVHHYRHPSDSTVVVQATVYNPYEIEYCRFVRMDGQGFMWDNVPNGYEIYNGNCTMHISNPTILDLHPWAIAVKFVGIRGEMSMSTTEDLLESLITPETDDGADDNNEANDNEAADDNDAGADHDHDDDDHIDIGHPDLIGDGDNNNKGLGNVWFWILMVFIGLAAGLVAFALIPKKNREWTYRNANGMRNSFRNSWDRAFNNKHAHEEEYARDTVPNAA